MTKHPLPFWHTGELELAALLVQVDPIQFDALLTALRDRSRRLFFSGQGRSGLIAQMAAMRFMHLGYTVHAVGEASAPAIGTGDRLILVCGSGRTPVSVAFAGIAKAAGAEIVLFTHKPASELAHVADLVLTVPAEGSVQFGGTAFEHATLVLLDALAHHLGHDQAAFEAMRRRHTNLQ